MHTLVTMWPLMVTMQWSELTLQISTQSQADTVLTQEGNRFVTRQIVKLRHKQLGSSSQPESSIPLTPPTGHQAVSGTGTNWNCLHRAHASALTMGHRPPHIRACAREEVLLHTVFPFGSTIHFVTFGSAKYPLYCLW